MFNDLSTPTDCLLSGFDGPIYPPALQQLLDTIKVGDLTLYVTSQVAGRIEGYDRSKRKYWETSDRYDWFDRMTFFVGRGIIVVCIPRFGRVMPSGAYRFDRCIAVFYKDVETCHVTLLLEELTRSFEKRNLESDNDGYSRDVPRGSP